MAFSRVILNGIFYVAFACLLAPIAKAGPCEKEFMGLASNISSDEVAWHETSEYRFFQFDRESDLREIVYIRNSVDREIRQNSCDLLPAGHAEDCRARRLAEQCKFGVIHREWMAAGGNKASKATVWKRIDSLFAEPVDEPPAVGRRIVIQ